VAGNAGRLVYVNLLQDSRLPNMGLRQSIFIREEDDVYNKGEGANAQC
jgi:hypothetical protein